MAKCTETITENCPHCNAGDRTNSYQLAHKHLSRWGCGSSEHINGKVMRSTECYERELAAASAEIERLRAENKRLESALEMTLETYNKTAHALMAVSSSPAPGSDEGASSTAPLPGR